MIPSSGGCVAAGLPSNQSQIIASANIENSPLNNLSSVETTQDPSTSTNKSEIAIIGINSYMFGERNNFEIIATAEPEITAVSDDSVYGFGHNFNETALNQTYNILRSEAQSKSSNESPTNDERITDELETHIQEMLALDIQHHNNKSRKNQVAAQSTQLNSMISLQPPSTTSQNNTNNFQKPQVFKSLPNLSSSNEKLFP